MKLIIDIPENEYEHIKEYYENNDIVESTYSYIYHGIPHETVTEFADRCRECGARYGKMLKDAISRETVIEWLKAKDIIKISSQEEMARKELKALPSVKVNETPTVDAIPISIIEDIKADISLLRDATINVNEDTAYGLWIALDLINKHINSNEFMGRNEI